MYKALNLSSIFFDAVTAICEPQSQVDKWSDPVPANLPLKRNRTITLAILSILVVMNAVWFAISLRSGASMAMILYAFILFFCWRMANYRAGVIAGLMGFGVHLYELLFDAPVDFLLLDSICFYLNLFLPLVLVFFSYQAYRSGK